MTYSYIALGAAAALFALSPASAQTLEAASYEAGVEARKAGDFADAAAIFEQETRRDPGNSDAWVQLGLSLIPLERYEEAEAAFEQALEIAPAYEDARIGLARIAWYRGNLTEARRQISMVGDRPDANQLRNQIETASRAPVTSRWRLDVAAGRSSLTQDLPDWEEYVVALGRRLDERTSVTGLVEQTVRFDNEDIYLQARLDRRLGQYSTGYVAVGGAPDADFRPELALLGGLVLPLAAGADAAPSLFMTFDGSLASYRSGEVASGTVGVRKSFFEDRLRLSVRGIVLSDETQDIRQGYSIGGEVQASSRARLILTHTDAPETSEGITIEVSSVSLGLRYELSDSVGLSITGTHEERRAYNRTGIVLGFTKRF